MRCTRAVQGFPQCRAFAIVCLAHRNAITRAHARARTSRLRVHARWSMPVKSPVYCLARNFRQRKISSKATVGQFVRNLFSSNVGRRSFAFWSFTLVKKISQDFNLVKNCSDESDEIKFLTKISCYTCTVHVGQLPRSRAIANDRRAILTRIARSFTARGQHAQSQSDRASWSSASCSAETWTRSHLIWAGGERRRSA